MVPGHQLSVLIVDDHAPFRTFTRRLLNGDGWNVVGEAADGATALAAVAALAPGVVLLDIQLPDRSGIDIARQLTLIPGAPRVVLMSSRDASDYGAQLRTASGCGFLPKHELSGAALASLIESTAHTARK